MSKPTKWLFLASMVLSIGTSFSQTRYVSTSGTDLGNDCTLPGNPCATIEQAATIALANDAIIVAPGSYSLASTIAFNVDGVSLAAEDANDKPIITTSVDDVISINASDITISNIRFEMGLTATSGMRGVVSTTNFDGLTLDGNEFISTKPAVTGMVFGSYAVSLNSPAGIVQDVTIENNTVAASGTGKDFFGRGFGLGTSVSDGPSGTIANNVVLAYYTLQAIRNAGQLTIEDNTLSGILMLNAPINDAAIVISSNTFDGLNETLANNLYTLLEIRSIENNATLEVSDNTFTNYTNIALLSMASKNVVVRANDFSPLATASTFVSIMANTKLMTSGVQGNTFSDEITIEGNIFSAGASLSGTAIVFADHYGANTPAFASTIVGGPLTGQKNSFDTNLGTYIKLDDQEGASTTVPLWATYPATTMKKFEQDVDAYAVYNNYGFVTFAEIEDKNYDQIIDPTLGEINLSAAGTNRYVAENGSNVVNSCTLPGNPCATIGYANSLANDNDSIIVAAGNYVIPATVSIDNDGVVLIADDLNDKPVITATTSTIVEINAENVEVNGFVFNMGLTAADGLKGIVGTTNFNNVLVKNNEFVSTKSLTTGLSFGAYAVSFNSDFGALDTVTISDNVVTTANDAANDYFGRGVSVGSGSSDGAQGSITNNDITAYYTIQAVRNSGDLAITNNTLGGIMMVNYPINDAAITVANNSFDGSTETVAYNLYSLADIRAIETGSVTLMNNTFENYVRIGLLSMASKNVEVTENTFTPSNTATSFVSLMANTKLMTNGTQANTYSDEISIMGNTFEAGLVGEGKAIVFADHYGMNAQAFAPGIVIGGPTATEKNTFDTDLGVFIELDSLTGASTAVELWAPYPATTMKPFSQNVEALMDNNIYGSDDLNEIELMNIDSLDNNILGKVILSYTTGAGLNELSAIGASIYPNPTSENLTISLNGKATSAQVELIDLLGNVVLTSEMNTVTTLNIVSLNSGVYIVKLSVNGKQYTSRIVKK